MAGAVVHIGPFNQPQARRIIRSFYEHCGLEVVGPGRITTGDIVTFDTLEELIDQLKKPGQAYHVVVCHGDAKRGLLVPFTSDTSANATGELIGKLGWKSQTITPEIARGPMISPLSGPENIDPEINDMAIHMAVSYKAALGLILKLTTMPPLDIEIRGCHLAEKPKPVKPKRGAPATFPDPLALLRDYKTALRAMTVSAPDARMFYVSMVPGRPTPPHTIASLAKGPPGGKTRRRLFRDDKTPALNQAGPLILDVTDHDGHTNVGAAGVMDVPANVIAWAVAIDGAWNGPAADGFVTQVIWDNEEKSYHTPFDVSYRGHLKRV
jgi:hypothetical protein